jgi:hypothetical protein
VNTVLSTSVDEHHHQHPSPLASVRRVSVADRVALHLGLALITWSRRPAKAAHQPSRNELHQRSVERTAREWHAERTLRLTVPTR